MVNVIVLWQTVYTQAALEHLAASGYPLDPADVARLTPPDYPTINLDGRYRTTSPPPTTGLRPLRTDLFRILYPILITGRALSELADRNFSNSHRPSSRGTFCVGAPPREHYLRGGFRLNRAEAQFTALRYFALDGTDHATHEDQARMIRRYNHLA